MLLGVLLSSIIPIITPADRSRAEQIVSKLSLEQKCYLISGRDDGFHTGAIPEAGIPSVRMADGPQGVRNKTNSTYYPCGLSLAASFNREVAAQVGDGIGTDASARGVRIMLCPGVNIYRYPLCGRNFEYYGEDPYLASETALNYISGIQGHRVIATIKHFAVNSQEFDRHGTSSNLDERTLNEIYLPTFRKAVEQAHVGAVMTSYNPVNGVHASENSELIGLLRSWGHEGIVMSDWTSTYTPLGTATSGLDLEMPRQYVGDYENIKRMIEDGQLDQSAIDLKCIHILQTFSAYGLLDKPMKEEGIPEDCDESRQKAYRAALEGPVLLKNEGGLLPVTKSKKGEIVLLGPNADVVAFGGGSGAMTPFPFRNITLRQAMEKLGNGYAVRYMDWKAPDEAAIAKARVVIVSVGFNNKSEGEGHDRTYGLPEGQNELIGKVAALNPRTVVIINSGGEVDIRPWKDRVAAILMAWYAGQEGGNALAALLTGAESPSGRLPFTFWGSLEENPVSPWYHAVTPAVKTKNPNRDPYPFCDYKEGVFLGYRGTGHFGKTPMYPFGYGLSYSSFAYEKLSVEAAGEAGVNVTFTIRNTGKVTAAEAAQVYVAPVAPSVIRPEKELKEFVKLRLAEGESRTVTLSLPRSAFSYYSLKKHDWVFDPGRYRIMVGASSEDIRLEAETVL